MRSASPFRRAGGLLAVATLGMSTAVLSAVGVAQAVPGGSVLTGPTTLTVPADMCTAQFVLRGGSGADAGSFVGGAGTQITLQLTVRPGEEYAADLATYAGGAGGTGGGAGGDGVGLLLDGDLLAVAAGGGGAGTLAAGGAAGEFGNSVPDADDTDNEYTSGGDPGSWSMPGNGGASGPDVIGGIAGGNGVEGTGGDAGGPGAGGGGGGLYGGGAGASDGTDGAGGGGGYSETADGSVGTSTGPASITYSYLACTGADVPLAPTALTATGGEGTLTVSFEPQWHDSGENAETWQYKLGAGSWTDVEAGYEGYDDALSFVLDGLTNGTTYTVQVRGVSDGGIHGAAASATGTPYQPIGAPANVRVSTSGTVITFTWDAPTVAGTHALDGYVGVLAANFGQSGGPVFSCENTAAQRVCAAPAAPGIDYSVFVTAVDALGNAGATAGPVSVGTLAPPANVPPSDGPLQAPPGATGGVGQGETVTITGSGYAPNTLVSVLIYSTPQLLTAVWTDGTGAFSIEITIPAGLAAGSHTLVAAGLDPDGNLRYLTLPVTVTSTTEALAYTGADIAGPAFGGLAALAVGGGLLFLGRRRPAAATPAEQQL